MEQRNMWNRRMGEKEDKCEFYEKQDAYCTKTQNKNCENIENDEKILMIC